MELSKNIKIKGQSCRLFFLAFLFVAYTPAQASEQTEKINNLEHRILDLELGAVSNSKFTIEGAFSSVYFRQDIDDENGFIKSHSSDNLTSNFSLDINNTADSRLKFYSRMSAEYFWNNNLQSPSVVMENSQEEYTGSYLSLERAYFDYFFPQKIIALSVGRLPTVDGPPIEKALGKERMGTYPLQLYSVPLDGLAATFNFHRLAGVKTGNFNRLVARFIYSPFYSVSTEYGATPAGREGGAHLLATNKGDAYYANLEASGDAGIFQFSAILQAYHSTFGRMRSIDQRGIFNEQCLKSDPSVAGLCTLGSPDRNVYEIHSSDHTLGELEAAIAYFDMQNIAGSDLDFYISYKLSEYTKRGSVNFTRLTDSSGGAAPIGTTASLGGFIYNEDVDAEEHLLGVRYKLSKKISLGYEYIDREYGSAPGILRTSGITDFYSSLGTGDHIYTNIELDKNLKAIFGYMKQEKTHEFIGLSYQPRPIDTELYYLNLYLDL